MSLVTIDDKPQRNKVEIIKVIADEDRRNDGYRKLFDMVEVYNKVDLRLLCTDCPTK